MAAREVVTTPGFVDAHTHLRSTPFAAQQLRATDLEEALLKMTAMTAVDGELDAFVAASDLVAAGITAAQVSFHTFEDAEGYLASLDALVRGVRASGLRALIILMLTDQAEYAPIGRQVPPPFAAKTDPARGIPPEEFEQVVSVARAQHPDMEFGVGPVAPQWASDEILSVITALAHQGMRVHTHLLESPRQRTWADPSPLARLDHFDLLGPGTSLAHGVWCSPEEVALIADSGTGLVTCPESNRLLGSGTANVSQWQAAGVVTGIGGDSAVQPGQLAQSANDRFGPDALAILTEGGAHCMGLTEPVGTVRWEDGITGPPNRVEINGQQLVSDGRLANHQRVAEARAKIRAQLERDADRRLAQMAAIDAFLPEYRAMLDA